MHGAWCCCSMFTTESFLEDTTFNYHHSSFDMDNSRFNSIIDWSHYARCLKLSIEGIMVGHPCGNWKWKWRISGNLIAFKRSEKINELHFEELGNCKLYRTWHASNGTAKSKQEDHFNRPFEVALSYWRTCVQMYSDAWLYRESMWSTPWRAACQIRETGYTQKRKTNKNHL